MASDFLNDYPLDYLLSRKDKETDFYQLLHNVCLTIIAGRNLSENKLAISWNVFRTFVFSIGIHLENKTWQNICDNFTNSFNHSNESPDDFMAWHFSDLLIETIHIDWGQHDLTKIPIDFSTLEKQKKVKKNKKRDSDIKWFFEYYVLKGTRFSERPSQNDLQVFARKTLSLIEDPKTKEVLISVSLGKFKQWLPTELQQTLDSIGKLTLRDGKMLIAAKPLLENWENAYSNRGQAGEVKEPPKPPEPKRMGGKLNLWLDWYHSMLDNGYKCTLEDVARKSGYSLGYIKQKHMVYQAKSNSKPNQI